MDAKQASFVAQQQDETEAKIDLTEDFIISNEAAVIQITSSYAAKNIKATIINIIGNLELVTLKAQTTTASGREEYEIRWYNVPLKDPAFIGREVQLLQLSNLLPHLATPHAYLPMAVCYGAGGVGKTHLAIEFIYQHLERYKTICWIPAHTEEAIKSAYGKLATGLGLQGRDSTEITKLVKGWLSAHGPSLLIYDAAPNYEVLENHLPAAGAHVLVTSRYSEWRTEGIKLNPFTSEQSRIYLLNRLGPRSVATNEQLDQLAVTFDYLPLALGQASAFIKKNILSIPHYLSLYHQNKRALLMNKTLPVNCHHVPVFENWDSTLKIIKQISPLALKLLNLFAYLFRSKIPYFLWQSFTDSKENNPKRELLQESLGLLDRHSLITIDISSRSFTLLPLLQEIVLLKLTFNEKINHLEVLFSLFKSLLDSSSIELEKFNHEHFLLPHLKSYLKRAKNLSQEMIKDENKMLMIVLSGYYCLVYYYHRIGNMPRRDAIIDKCTKLVDSYSSSGMYSLMSTLYEQIGEAERAEEYATFALSVTGRFESESANTEAEEENLPPLLTEEEFLQQQAMTSGNINVSRNAEVQIRHTTTLSATMLDCTAENIIRLPTVKLYSREKGKEKILLDEDKLEGCLPISSAISSVQLQPTIAPLPRVFIEDSHAGKDINASVLNHIGKLKMVKSEMLIAKQKRYYTTRLWNVPSRNPNFTGREALLDELIERIRRSGEQKINPVVITAYHGLGGVGKTQLAIEFIYRHYEQYELISWIPAENVAQIADAYLELAQDLQLLPADKKIPSEEIVQLVKVWLCNHPKSLLIFDNASNYDSIESYLPQTGSDILITTRYTEWLDKSIEIDVFTLAEARDYIQKILGNRDIDSIELIEKLAELVGRLPLALAQATAYIKQNRLHIKQYLDIYGQRKAYLLAKETLPSGDHHIPVYITWDITMQTIAKESQLAPRILNMCAYFYNENIPACLLKAFADQPDINPKAELFEETFGILNSYSMLVIDEANYTATIHRLVQEVIRDQLEVASEREIYLTKSCGTLIKIYPYGKDQQADLLLRKVLLLHLKALLGHLDDWVDKMKVKKGVKEDYEVNLILPLLICLGDAVSDLGIGDAKTKKILLKRALIIEERHYGKEHVEVAKSLANLGSAYGDSGNMQMMKMLMKRALAIKERYYGKEHVGVGKTLIKRGIAYGDLGNANKKRIRLERALTIFEQQYGQEHIEVATTLSDLGNAYGDLGDARTKKTMLERALPIMERHYGKKNIEVARALGNLGNTYGVLGDTRRMEILLGQVLATQEEHYGKEHVEVASTLVNLAICYKQQGNIVTALAHAQRAYKSFLHHSQVGMVHPHMQKAAQLLAMLLARTGSSSSTLFLKTHLKAHPQDIVAWLQLAQHYYHEAKLAKAVQAYEQLIQLDPGNFAYYHNVACLYHIQDELELAQRYFEQALKVAPNASTYCDYGLLLLRQQQFQAAVDCFEQAIERKADKSGLMYDKLERRLMDAYWQQELDSQGQIQIDPVVMAYYYLHACYQQCGKKEEGEHTLKAFTSYVTEHPDALSYRLLSYRYEACGQHEQSQLCRAKAEAIPTLLFLLSIAPQYASLTTPTSSTARTSFFAPLVPDKDEELPLLLCEEEFTLRRWQEVRTQVTALSTYNDVMVSKVVGKELYVALPVDVKESWQKRELMERTLEELKGYLAQALDSLIEEMRVSYSLTTNQCQLLVTAKSTAHAQLIQQLLQEARLQCHKPDIHTLGPKPIKESLKSLCFQILWQSNVKELPNKHKGQTVPWELREEYKGYRP